LTEENPRQLKSNEEWRDWLKSNYDSAEVIWIVIQKKASKEQGIRYEEAVAHGWIDGKMRRIDDDKFMQRFTPRRPDSIWSKSNKKRVEKLIKEGRMTPAGLEAVQKARESGQWDKVYSSREPIEIPDDLKQALSENPEAEDNFRAFPPSARFMYIHWINEAKRQDTRQRRIYTVLVRSELGKKPEIDLRVLKPE
jgi:uncharacterized protein YdeI (YjbR/CyaY-like superfamily)